MQPFRETEANRPWQCWQKNVLNWLVKPIWSAWMGAFQCIDLRRYGWLQNLLTYQSSKLLNWKPKLAWKPNPLSHCVWDLCLKHQLTYVLHTYTNSLGMWQSGDQRFSDQSRDHATTVIPTVGTGLSNASPLLWYEISTIKNATV